VKNNIPGAGKSGTNNHADIGNYEVEN